MVMYGRSEYEGLRGIIREIRDGKDKETENVTPDIYCDFDVPESEDEVIQLEKRFSSLYETQKSIDDIVPDCVIMKKRVMRCLCLHKATYDEKTHGAESDMSPDMLVPVE